MLYSTQSFWARRNVFRSSTRSVERAPRASSPNIATTAVFSNAIMFEPGE
jgi:hypothetical protein